MSTWSCRHSPCCTVLDVIVQPGNTTSARTSRSPCEAHLPRRVREQTQPGAKQSTPQAWCRHRQPGSKTSDHRWPEATHRHDASPRASPGAPTSTVSNCGRRRAQSTGSEPSDAPRPGNQSYAQTIYNLYTTPPSTQ